MRFPSRAIAVWAALLCLAWSGAAEAAYTSQVVGTVAVMAGDASGDLLAISSAGGLFRHNRWALGDPGFNSDADFDTSVAGDQTIDAATGIININAGDGDDTIALADGIDLRGAIHGGAGIHDKLDYGSFSTAIHANLGLGTTGLNATLGPDQQVPAATSTATGTATVSNYNIVTRTFDITVTVANLPPGDVTGFHMHQGTVGANGPIIVDFTGVAPLVPAGGGFTFTATGLVLPAGSEAAFLGGATYVNIHNAAFPNGVIRGQLFSTGDVNLATGTATGTTSIAGIEGVTGGAGGDSLVGSFALNSIAGGAGADWIVGGPDVSGPMLEGLDGGSGPDVFLWNHGHGTEFVHGGGDSDTLQVNGNTSAGEHFLLRGSGPFFTVERTNVDPAQVISERIERVIVNGIGGNDAFTIGSLEGDVSFSLTALDLNGFDGDDLFGFIPASAGGVAVTVRGGPGTDQLAGPGSATTWNVTAANQGNIAGLVAGFSFIEMLSGATGSDTFNVKAFPTGTLQVSGGGTGTASVDTLNYNAESRSVSGDTTPPDGVINSPGVQPVDFFQFETVNIVNPQPGIAISDVSVVEGAAPGSAVFNVTLTNASALTVTVDFTTVGYTAMAVSDFLSQVGMLTFAPGETLKTITVPIVDDASREPTEIFLVNLSGAVNAHVTDNQGLGTIVDDDTAGDFDGDGKADLVVFRPGSGTWFTLPSSTGFTGGTSTAFGASGDLPVPGDYDGDGKSDLAYFHPADGTWHILRSSTATVITSTWGVATDLPAPGDYDGDGKTDLAVYRPSTGTWHILQSSNSIVRTVGLGVSTDIPVPADYDFDGVTDVALYRPSTGRWSIRTSSTGGATSLVLQWGADGDVPVPGDYDGDGRADVAVFRPSTGMWFLLRSTTSYSAFTAVGWGSAGDLAVPADYDGDNRTDVAIFRPGTGTWHLLKSSSNFTTADAIQWGLSGDIPTPGAAIRTAIAAVSGQATLSTLANRSRESDFDGDGRADVTVWRPSNGTWFTRSSKTGYSTFNTFQWGLSGDVPVPGDYDGDGTTDITVWRPADGRWFILTSSVNFLSSVTYQWGVNGDVPVPGDYDGDGRTDLAVYRPSNGVWYIRESRVNYTTSASYQWGLSSDVAVPGDYDGDGLTDLAVWRPSTGEWYVRQSSTGYTTSVTYQWGLPGDVAVPGDYDGDGRTDFTVFRPSTGVWFVTQSTTGATTFASYPLGVSGDTPVAGDYDGDGRSDLAVFRPSNGLWSFLTSSSGFTTMSSFVWGDSTDIPILRRP